MNNYFEKVSPESVGISTSSIETFIDNLNCNNICLHSFAFIRNGKLCSYGYEKHFPEDFKHRMYSVSKSFTSAAIGCLIGEGKLSLDEPVYKYFQEKYEGNLHPYIKETTVRHLLMMSTPFDETTYNNNDPDWVWTFFNTKPSHRPGTVFHYDTSATLVLCALINKITEKDFTEYLYDKVLKYVGFSQIPKCVREPGGIQWGGSGVLCTTLELAGLAYLFLNKGRDLSGVQRIPEWYIEEATSYQICNTESNAYNAYTSHGYGYQIWITQDGFSFLGMGNQLAICYPKYNLLFVCTSDDQGNDFARSYIYDGLKKYIIDNFSEEQLNGNSHLDLSNKLCLKLPFTNSDAIPEFDFKEGIEFKLADNKKGITDILFYIFEKEGRMLFTRSGIKKEIKFGIDSFVDGEFPEPSYSGSIIGTPADHLYRYSAGAVWAEKDKLILRVYIIDEYFGTMTANISFKGRKLDMHVTKKAEWFLEEYTGYFSSIN